MSRFIFAQQTSGSEAQVAIDAQRVPPRRALLLIELLALFFGSPLLITSGIWPVRLLMGLLALGAIYTAGVAIACKAPRRVLGLTHMDRSAAWKSIRIGLAFWAAGLAIVATINLTKGWRVFPLVSDKPRIFLLICGVYIFSVAAQEFVFRSWFFWRYRSLLSPSSLLAVNVLAFGWAHIVFGSSVSVILTLLGGLIFTGLYRKHRSLIGVCVVHAIIGMSMFAMGYGRFFYHGNSAIAQELRQDR